MCTLQGTLHTRKNCNESLCGLKSVWTWIVLNYSRFKLFTSARRSAKDEEKHDGLILQFPGPQEVFQFAISLKPARRGWGSMLKFSVWRQLKKWYQMRMGEANHLKFWLQRPWNTAFFHNSQQMSRKKVSSDLKIKKQIHDQKKQVNQEKKRENSINNNNYDDKYNNTCDNSWINDYKLISYNCYNSGKNCLHYLMPLNFSLRWICFNNKINLTKKLKCLK